MDSTALKYANAMLGNPDEAAGLECTVIGPELLFNCDLWVCITGARTSPVLDGVAMPDHAPFLVTRGSTLRVGPVTEGMRAYVAVGGGVDVPEVMGSRATDLVAHIGGISGRALRRGDIVQVSWQESPPPGSLPEDTALPTLPGFQPFYMRDRSVLRVVPGPQDDRFTSDAMETFLSASYTVTAESNRMGYRLSGPPLAHVRGADIVSDGIVFGAVQVPGHGQPIILMADRQTTGGYTKIACVISADFPLLGQLGPGSEVRFKSVTLKEAQLARRELEEEFERFKLSLSQMTADRDSNSRRYSISLNGMTYKVLVEKLYT
jgi:biotin-dependent carboxylase-like uncharacterized protein